MSNNNNDNGEICCNLDSRERSTVKACADVKNSSNNNNNNNNDNNDDDNNNNNK